MLEELKMDFETPMKLFRDNKSAINIANSPVQHDRTKHIEVDRHFIKEKLDTGVICTTVCHLSPPSNLHLSPPNNKLLMH